MRSLPLVSADHQAHVSFARIAPYLRSALVIASGGGFALACVLTLAPLFGIPLGSWWEALIQTHGHLQIFGWAGLFVVGVALHFFPRLRGAPLVWPALLPWILGVYVSGLVLRFISQPLFAMNGAMPWKILLVFSGILEVIALPAIFLLLVKAASQSSVKKTAMEGVRSIAPFIFGAFLALSLAGVLNLLNCIAALNSGGVVPTVGDEANITIGLFGFLVPVALAMSSRMLPLYAHVRPFPTLLLQSLALVYFGGVILWLLGLYQPELFFARLNGLGFLLIGIVILIFIGYFMYLVLNRVSLPPQGTAALTPAMAQVQAERIRQGRREERSKYGPYVALISSAYLWGALGALLLIVNGVAVLLFGEESVSVDVIRHSFAIGFITLLICGLAVRMVPGFSGKTIRSSRLVTATLWLGNLAALLRVGSLLLGSALPGSDLLFSLSGPTGLALILCLAVNLWPAL